MESLPEERPWVFCCSSAIAYPHRTAMQRRDGPRGNSAKVTGAGDARETQMAPPLLFLFSPCYNLLSLEAEAITLQVYIQICLSSTQTWNTKLRQVFAGFVFWFQSELRVSIILR